MRKYGFPRSVRLRKKAEFERVFAEGKRYRAPLCVLYVLHHPCSKEKKVGIAVGRKLGKATVRNKIKRRIREILRLHLPQLLPGTHLVVVARSRASDADFHELERTLLCLMREGEVLRDE